MSQVLGIGVDLVDVDRIRSSIETYGERFLQRVFSPPERAYCDGRARRFEHYAGRFAAKEAVLKALGTGWARQAGFRDIEIVPTATGAPDVILGERIAQMLLAEGGRCRCLISISHTPQAAVAQALLVVDTPDAA